MRHGWREGLKDGAWVGGRRRFGRPAPESEAELAVAGWAGPEEEARGWDEESGPRGWHRNEGGARGGRAVQKRVTGQESGESEQAE